MNSEPAQSIQRVTITYRSGRKNARGSERGGAPVAGGSKGEQAVALGSLRPRFRSVARTEAEGKLLVAGPARERLAARFWAKTIPEPTTGCLLWMGSLHRLGYGLFRVGELCVGAHRVAYFLAHGALAPGQEASHRCDVRWCVEPRHLYAASHAENLGDCARRRRGREARGEANSHARLTGDAVRNLRAAHARGATVAQLAAGWCIGAAHVRAILSGRRWSHIPVATLAENSR